MQDSNRRSPILPIHQLALDRSTASAAIWKISWQVFADVF